VNPLSDGFVDVEMVAEYQQRLLDAAVDRDVLAARARARSSSLPAWLRRLWRSVPAAVTSPALVGPGHRDCPFTRCRCA